MGGCSIFPLQTISKAELLLLCGIRSRAEQLQTRAPHLSLHYYHNLWWERNRSSIRSVGKVTAPKAPVPPFGQRARRGQLACLVRLCVLSLITAGLKRTGGVAAFIRSSRPPPLVAGGLRTPSDHLTEAKVSPAPPNLCTQQHHLICDQRSPGVTLHPTSTQTPSSPRLTFPPPCPLCPPVVPETQLLLRPPFSCAHVCECVCRCGSRGQSRS